MSEKSEGAFRTIGEVAESLDLPQHVLRFWETRFKEIEPVKRAGGRRYYRPRDVELLQAIRHLLYGKGYTIKGVQRILKEQGARAVIEGSRSEGPGIEPPAQLFDDSFESEVIEAAAPLERQAGARSVEVEPPFLGPSTVAPALDKGVREPAFHLDDASRRRLREALEEISECQRLLTLTRR